MANALSDFIGGFQAGDQITSNQREQRQQNQLARLAPLVVSGDPQAYAQAAAIDPKAAQQYQKSEDQIAMKARGAAKYLQSALQSGNQQQIMAARQTIKPFMDTLKPGSSYPLDMDPAQEAAGLQDFLAQTEYIDRNASSGRVQSTYINRAGQRVAIMRDGSQQVLGEADARTQLRDQEGIAPSIVDLRTGAATPLNEGGQLPQQQVPGVYIDPSLPPEVQAQIRQAEATGGQVPGQMFINQPVQGGGGIAAARPAISASEQARLDLAQQANARAVEAERRAQEAADRSARGNPPTGYRWKADGSGVEPIPGAPSNASVGSEDERKAAGWYGQATRALSNMRAAVAEDKDADTPGLIETYIPNAEIANRSRDPARQRYANASSSLAEALLRAATGAGVNESEARQKILEVTPQRGDSKEVKQQKMRAAEGYLADLQARAGRALKAGAPNPATPANSGSSYSDLWK